MEVFFVHLVKYNKKEETMKSKLNLFLIGALLISAFSFVSCDNDDNDDPDTVIGKWYLYKQSQIYTFMGTTETYNWTYNSALDVDYFGIELIEITDTEVVGYYNETGGAYDYDRSTYELTDSMIIFIEIDSSDVYMDTMMYHFQDGMLVLTESYENVFQSGESTTYLKRYNGNIPPDSWVTNLANDGFEPDNSYQDATQLQLGVMSDMHVTVAGDADWFKFNASAGQTYLMQVSGYVDGYLYLYDTNGTTLLDEDDDNGADVDVSYWGNPALLWDCPSSGTYYFKITGYGDDSEGYYKVEVNTSDLNNKSIKKDNKKNKRTLSILKK
jgi:hypothetical protein